MEAILIVTILGIIVSSYALYVEEKLEKQSNYKAICDIKHNISCTKSFKSKYGKTFGVENSAIGLLFYILVLVLIFYNIRVVFYLAIVSIIVSIYLAYISYYKLRNFCLVCSLVYIINILLLVFSYLAIS